MWNIPYIEHELRMYKAYKREKRLKMLLTVSNLVWVAVVAVLMLLQRDKKNVSAAEDKEMAEDEVFDGQDSKIILQI